MGLLLSEQDQLGLGHVFVPPLTGTLQANEAGNGYIDFVNAGAFLLGYTGASGVFPETALQLAAYCRAEFIVEPDGEQRPLPETEGAAAISLRPDHYKVLPIRVDDEVFDVFRHLVSVANWQRTVSKSVLGAPVQPKATGGN